MRSERHFILVLSATLAACQSDPRPPPGAGVHIEDSAGVRIVEYAVTPDTEAPFRLAPEPRYRYGAGPGDYMFTWVAAGVLLNDGGAAIYDAASGDLMLLGPDGRSGSVLASRGEGPSEVDGPPKAMLPLGQDSLLVQDYANTRFSLFAGGSFVRTTTIAPELSQAFGARGITDDGNVLMSSTRSVRPSQEGWEPGYLVRLDLADGAIDTIASYDWVPPRPPIGTRTRNPASHHGAIVPVRGEFVHARTDKPELTWRRMDGSIRQIARWHPEWVYPTDEHRDQLAREMKSGLQDELGTLTEEDRAATIESALATFQFDTDKPLPIFTGLMADDEGRVWLREYYPSLETTTRSYIVFSPDGMRLGQVNVPEGLRVFDVNRGRVLGVMKGEMDVLNVVVYKLVVR